MKTVLIEWLLYALTVMSIGSYAAAFTARWPVKNAYLWKKEAFELLSLPFNTPPPMQVSQKRSHCFQCHQTLVWQDLIPLLSYLLLKGKCRYCKSTISYRYPTIEFLHLTCCFPLLWLTHDIYQLTLQTLLISCLITSTAIDIEHKLIPDECNMLALGCALLLHASSNTLEYSVFGMLIGYSLVYIIRWFYMAVRKCEGIGLGDAKLIAALGAWLGFPSLAPLLLCASLSGILYTVLLKRNGSNHMAFGPFLIFSAMLVFYL
jgi:leader peptidase (prepilin peptidase) / N-methyltransferase